MRVGLPPIGFDVFGQLPRGLRQRRREEADGVTDPATARRVPRESLPRFARPKPQSPVRLVRHRDAWLQRESHPLQAHFALASTARTAKFPT